MIVCQGPTALRLGRLAASMRRDETAEEHLRDAIDLAAKVGARPYLAEARFALAELRAGRGGMGVRADAVSDVDAALAIAREVGMATLVEGALALKLELTGAAGSGGEGRTLPFDKPSQ
jgi:hypothetical protein